MINFFKYQGAGNDFIMIDNRNGQFRHDKIAFAKKWCDRKFGIGSDGIIFIEQKEAADFEMDFYNPDGSQSFCGNGSRCAVAFASKLNIVEKDCVFSAIDGLHLAKIQANSFHIKMGDVESIQKIGDDLMLDTGSPHYIKFCASIGSMDVVEAGKEVRYSDQFKAKGINVNFLEKEGANAIRLRTYERGVENETLACGTGATAAALSFAEKEGIDAGTIDVKVQGGELQVAFEKNAKGFKDVWLIGPAVEVFKGVIEDEH